MTLGEQIRAAREAKNLSQEALSELLGVSRQAVSKWENNTAVPQGINMSILIETLDLNVETEAPSPQKKGLAFWLGWGLTGVLFAVLIAGLIWLISSGTPSLGESAENKPELISVRFFDETQEEVLVRDQDYSNTYNVAQIDSILLQWTGDAPLESVKMFYTPHGEKTQLADEFSSPPDRSHALLVPADSLHHKVPMHIYFELHFEGNYTLVSDQINTFYNDSFELYSYIDNFDGETITFDRVEWVNIPSKRAGILGLTDNDGPNGFYIYNERNAIARHPVSADCTYITLDWDADFVPVEVSASNFQSILAERNFPGTPYVLTFQEGKIVSVKEYYIP